MQIASWLKLSYYNNCDSSITLFKTSSTLWKALKSDCFHKPESLLSLQDKSIKTVRWHLKKSWNWEFWHNLRCKFILKEADFLKNQLALINNNFIYPSLEEKYIMVWHNGNSYMYIVAASWCKRHRKCCNRTLPHKPILCIVLFVLLSFCSLFFDINYVFHTN